MGKRKPGTDLVEWEVDVPTTDEQFIPIVRPRAGETVRGICLCMAMSTCRLHFVDERTVPCRGERRGCPHCKDKLSRIFRGYVGCLLLPSQRLTVFEITTWAAQHCPKLTDKSFNLRAVRLSLSRPARQPKGRVTAELDQVRIRTEALPEAFDVRKALLRVWSREEEDQDHIFGLASAGEKQL